MPSTSRGCRICWVTGNEGSAETRSGKTRNAGRSRECVVSAREMLLFCIGSSMDRTKAGINDAVVTGVVVKGLADRDAAGTLALTDRGRAMLRDFVRAISFNGRASAALVSHHVYRSVPVPA